MPDDIHTLSEKAHRLLMANLKGHAAPMIYVYHIIGWVHIAAGKSVDYHNRSCSLSFDALTTRVLEGLLKWITQPRTREELKTFAALECRCTEIELRSGDLVHRRGEREHKRDDWIRGGAC
jgi:hypothetical protein